MTRRLSWSFLVAALAAGLLASCEAANDAEEGAVAVAPGKQDNYLSPTSREYRLWGLGDLKLGAEFKGKSDAEKKAQVDEMLGYRFKAYAHFINQYVTNKEHEDANAKYGGFSGLVRATPAEWVVEPLDDAHLAWTFVWELEMGGPRNIVDAMPTKVDAEGHRYFLVKMPKLTEAQLEAGSYPSTFDPATFNGEVEDVQVMIEAEQESMDAWPEYKALFEDGRLDVVILVGGDYNAERYDLKAAREIFSWLGRAGYASTVKTFETLKLDSPTFQKTVKAGGKSVLVSIRLLHADIVEDGRLNDLRAAVLEGFKNADIVIYDGHAGLDPSYSGVVYHYNPRHAISADELAQADLADRYQVYVFNGCKTYGAYPDTLMKNPRKTTKTLDILSTVNFSWLSMQPFTTSGFLNAILAQRNGTHDPRTWREVLADINAGANSNVFYGVHGLDDNPHLNPWADASKLCKSCSKDADCGGAGNRCVRFDWGRVCGAECTANDGCPAGYACTAIAEGSTLAGKQCLPKTFQCQ